ncbi:D-3-phosphoglycerate dehydrogenase [Luminiphilus syltensis NOR5-1B]|uniref:D-3-phosphoglycerate dehydrogenase n=1 Tax=Luminiphilus syltensis NOR5-1B TaxID=565045 RepID=B8KU15_9GAMM|nr:D-2-hydroxyacid dehydrogenase [Luminiphilus syltensis]EED34357.1 D-3-phosphoglycerate dehydrogenase [Luminiphilus syltensis NOR5-1B]
MKAVFLDYASMGPDLDLSPLQNLVEHLDVFDTTEDDQVVERIRGSQLVFTNAIELSAEVLSAAPELAFIGLTATGTDNIDLDAAGEAGIVVSNLRAYCTQSVVEHVIGTLLMLSHNLNHYSSHVRRGGWQQSQDGNDLVWPIREVSGLTLGIIGFGELGRGVAKAATGLGMDVVVAARPGSPTVPEGRESLAEIYRRCDVISLHCPLDDNTRGLINADALDAMKDNALLINTARGALIDTAALATALSSKTIAGAAIDVLPQEPPVDGDPLLDYTGDNLILTPHIAWGSREARQRAIDGITLNAAAFMRGEPQNRVA